VSLGNRELVIKIDVTGAQAFIQDPILASHKSNHWWLPPLTSGPAVSGQPRTHTCGGQASSQ